MSGFVHGDKEIAGFHFGSFDGIHGDYRGSGRKIRSDGNSRRSAQFEPGPVDVRA